MGKNLTLNWRNWCVSQFNNAIEGRLEQLYLEGKDCVNYKYEDLTWYQQVFVVLANLISDMGKYECLGSLQVAHSYSHNYCGDFNADKKFLENIKSTCNNPDVSYQECLTLVENHSSILGLPRMDGCKSDFVE
ncbi:MAG: hypothetical protein RLN62_05430 [Rickettsiales bacterium]